MRRYKTPERLKEWRINFDLLKDEILERDNEHERKMREWLDENADPRKGDTFICPDGLARKLTPYQLHKNKIRFS